MYKHAAETIPYHAPGEHLPKQNRFDDAVKASPVGAAASLASGTAGSSLGSSTRKTKKKMNRFKARTRAASRKAGLQSGRGRLSSFRSTSINHLHVRPPGPGGRDVSYVQAGKRNRVARRSRIIGLDFFFLQAAGMKIVKGISLMRAWASLIEQVEGEPNATLSMVGVFTESRFLAWNKAVGVKPDQA